MEGKCSLTSASFPDPIGAWERGLAWHCLTNGWGGILEYGEHYS